MKRKMARGQKPTAAGWEKQFFWSSAPCMKNGEMTVSKKGNRGDKVLGKGKRFGTQKKKKGGRNDPQRIEIPIRRALRGDAEFPGEEMVHWLCFAKETKKEKDQKQQSRAFGYRHQEKSRLRVEVAAPRGSRRKKDPKGFRKGH